MYDHTRQYRCTIIRGKSQKEMDDLLPAYALEIDEICPCPTDKFDLLFNEAFKRFLPESERIKKTLDNHRTEISGKLFGMYYRADDGNVYKSQRTSKYLEDSDQPAFFKDICYKMQFPNGMDSSNTVKKRLEAGIKIRPNSFVLKVLQLAADAKQQITINDIGYYILNSLDVLQGKATPIEVLDTIIDDHKRGMQRKIEAYDEEGKPKAPSYTMQHIREQLNYLELANLIRITANKCVILNPNELKTINLFTSVVNQEPEFNLYSYNLDNVDSRKKFQQEWDFYFAKLSEVANKFITTSESLNYDPEKQKDKEITEKKANNLTEFGDEGEALVFEYEKERVSAFNKRLAQKVLSLGKTKGIGYDIQSVIAKPGDEAEFVKYIEVKSTKRFTCPDLDDSLWMDTLNVTRNEYVAAQQHGEYYSIYRVFFTRNGVSVFVIENVADKIKSGKIQVPPVTYRIDYSSEAVNSMITLKREQ